MKLTITSKVKYFLRFLIIITKNGNLMPNVALASKQKVWLVSNYDNNVGTCGTRHVCRRDIGALDFEYKRLDVVVRDAFYVPIAHFLIPNRQRLRANWVEDGQEAGLEGVFEHVRLASFWGVKKV